MTALRLGARQRLAVLAAVVLDNLDAWTDDLPDDLEPLYELAAATSHATAPYPTIGVPGFEQARNARDRAAAEEVLDTTITAYMAPFDDPLDGRLEAVRGRILEELGR